MTDRPADCSHPRRCSGSFPFTDKIKTDKIALDPPPPGVLVKPPSE